MSRCVPSAGARDPFLSRAALLESIRDATELQTEWMVGRVGVDVAPAMLAVASTVDPTIDWREGNATSLPVRTTEHFTVLTCHQGLQFMPDKPAAIREMRRVLAPGGRVAIATWRSLEDTPAVLELNAVAERHVGRIVDSRHSLGDADALNNLLVDAGFSDVSVGTLAHDVQYIATAHV
jgi:ubiquinone/menaquinone biosynthesis C-methylase UbiE